MITVNGLMICLLNGQKKKKERKKMIDYSIPYSFEIKEQDDGTFQIVICAIGFRTPEHAQDFIKDIGNYEIKTEKPTLH